MKKSTLVKLIPLILIFLSAIALISAADDSATAAAANPNAQIGTPPEAQNPNEIIAQQFGINPEKLDIGEIRRNYLAKEWGLIVANTSYIGPVHKFFMAHQNYFVIIFGVPYEFSLTFFLVAFLWFFMMFNVKKIVNAVKIVNGNWFPWVMGILIAVILAQSGLLKGIVNFTLNIILGQENWWIRGIICIVVFVIIILAQYLSVATSKYLAAQERAKEAAKTKQASKVVQATAQGIETS